MKKEKTREARYMSIFSYTNYLRLFYRAFVLFFTKPTSLIVTVFLRKDFGERYFTLSACLTFGIILLVPYFAAQELSNYTDIVNAINFTWLLFILTFIGFSIKRRMEFDRKSKTVRTDRFSYFEGELNYGIWDWVEGKTKFLKADPIYIKRYHEPLLVFLTGVVLMLLYITRFVGFFLVIVSVLQYMRVAVQYAIGRDFLLDEIDKVIAKEKMRDTIVFDKPTSQTKGFSVFAPRPESKEVREKIVDQILGEEKKEDVVTL